VMLMLVRFCLRTRNWFPSSSTEPVPITTTSSHA
jgi:hypothetical protein